MNVFDIFVITGLASVGLMLVLTFVLPPLQHAASSVSLRLDDMLAGYHFTWFSRSMASSQRAGQRRTEREFLSWLSSRVGDMGGDAVDGDLLEAQRLMPMLRLLLEEEIPTAIRRCNSIHHRMAVLTGAVHLRDVAAEPECFALRRWTVQLLANTHELLRQYPMRLRLESDDLLHASIVLRKSLLPTCTRCPYIQKSVLAAGERCSAAEFIQIQTGGCDV